MAMNNTTNTSNSHSETLNFDSSSGKELIKDVVTSPLLKLYNILKSSEFLNKYGTIALILIIVLILLILTIPARAAIELAGRLIGENPDVGFFGALFLMTMMAINPLIGLIFFWLWFRDEMPTGKIIVLAFLSEIMIGFIELIVIVVLLLIFGIGISL